MNHRENKYNKKISILVVLFNKKLNESQTLSSLLQCQSSSDVSLKILNNGPQEIKAEGEVFQVLTSSFKDVMLESRLENAPLSKLYNEFIDSNLDSDYFIILDDDSHLDEDFIFNVYKTDADVIIPRVLSVDDGDFYYPTQNGVVVEHDGWVDLSSLMSISSGLTFSKKLVSTMLSYYPDVFDEHFSLYGIDTSFFLRLRKIVKSDSPILLAKCVSIICHSLSRIQKENVSKFRVVERLYDFAITARHYPEYVSRLWLFKRIVKYSMLMQFEYAWILFRYYVKGRHPKC
ncbi:hypothetical protein [Dickeya dadantii]|uniref:hypothetical protein n=1 Tax=Dickeya dadantii TaxID=204038 RepID=UPI001C0E3E8E|nr:hypothetical protein [Dickeya dadantii]QWT39996.1 hypothetical protein KNV89_16735 [Dickeya dadantii]